MKYVGPLRVISNVGLDQITEYINLGRTQIGLQKSSNSDHVKSHYKSTILPNGIQVETWYGYNNYSCKVTVPEVPPIPGEFYIPGIVMAPMDDVGKWGYGTPFNDPLGTACPTYDIVKFGSSLLTPKYLPGTTDYDKSLVIRPWKQRSVDPVAADDSFFVGQYAFPKFNADNRYLGNVVFPAISTPGFEGTQFYGLFYVDIPPYWSDGSITIDATDSSKDRNDGYYVLERFRQSSIGVVSVQGIPKVCYDGYAYKYLQDTTTDPIEESIFYCRRVASGIPSTGIDVTFYFQKYNLTEHGKYLTNPIYLSPNMEVLSSYTATDIGCYYDIYNDPDLMKGSQYYQAIGGTTNQFYICHSKPRFGDNRRYDNAVGIIWKTYEISTDYTAITNTATIDYQTIPGDYTYDSLANYYQHWDIVVDDVAERIVAAGNTYKGEYRQLTMGYSDITFSHDIDDEDGFGGDPGVSTGSYSVTKNYTIPDGSGGTLTFSLTDEGTYGTATALSGSHLSFIECNIHADTYVYAIVAFTAEISGGTTTLEGTIDFYRNGTLFYSYATSSPVTVNFSTMQLPWLGSTQYASTRKLDVCLRRYFLGDFEGDLQDAETGTAYFDTPFLDTFTWWMNESEYVDPPGYTEYYAYTVDCRTIVDPGKDFANSNKITVLAMKEPLEGSMDTQPIKYFLFWNNELLDGKTVEEMLLIDAKTNPRITNFGVI
jgi:hypothetical protein